MWGVLPNKFTQKVNIHLMVKLLVMVKYLIILKKTTIFIARSYYVVVPLFSCVWLFATPCTAACQASLSFTIPQSLLKLISIESVMPFNLLILCPLLLLPSIFPSIRVFSNEGHIVSKSEHLVWLLFVFILFLFSFFNLWKYDNTFTRVLANTEQSCT